MIALIDYRAGNLTSVRKALAAVGAEVLSPACPADLKRSSAVIVPGVGHFKATAALDDGWRQAILEGIEAGRPLLGICLGLQWLFDGSEEAPELSGLGLFPGRCVLLTPEAKSHGADGHSPDGSQFKVPHVGWNTLSLQRASGLMEHVPDQAHVYLTHSYVAPVTPACVATTVHGTPFASVVERDRIFGVQFHPEKSGPVGLTVLRNFLALTKK